MLDGRADRKAGKEGGKQAFEATYATYSTTYEMGLVFWFGVGHFHNYEAMNYRSNLSYISSPGFTLVPVLFLT